MVVVVETLVVVIEHKAVCAMPSRLLLSGLVTLKHSLLKSLVIRAIISWRRCRRLIFHYC